MYKYLQISANDPYEISIENLLIDLDSNKIVGGNISTYDDEYNISKTYTIEEYLTDYSDIWAKVNDSGTYTLFDKDMKELKTVKGYVPEWIDRRYNAHEGFGDYIDFVIWSDNKLVRYDVQIEYYIDLLIKTLSSVDNNYSVKTIFKNIRELENVKIMDNNPLTSENINKAVNILRNDLNNYESIRDLL